MNESVKQGRYASGVVRLFGVNIPARKKIRAGLPLIYGIGKHNVFNICFDLQINPDGRMYELSESELDRLRKHVESNVKVEGTLRSEVSSNIKRLISIGCYRGQRHKKGLPVRGQRTRTNARTRKGRKSSPITGKKKVAK